MPTKMIKNGNTGQNSEYLLMHFNVFKPKGDQVKSSDERVLSC